MDTVNLWRDHHIQLISTAIITFHFLKLENLSIRLRIEQEIQIMQMNDMQTIPDMFLQSYFFWIFKLQRGLYILRNVSRYLINLIMNCAKIKKLSCNSSQGSPF